MFKTEHNKSGVSMLIVSRFLVPKGYKAMAIWPFIFFKDQRTRDEKTTVLHERIHLRQQIEMLLIFFYVWYALEYLYHATKGAGAYRKIKFEKEAFANEENPHYLEQRKFFAWVKY